MDHWFDDLTKGLARGNWSRRAMLGSALKAGAAAIGGALLGRSGDLGQIVLANSEAQRDEGLCNIRQEGRTQTLTLSAKTSFKGKHLTFEQTTRNVFPAGEITITKLIRLEGKPLLQIEAVNRGGSTRVTINHGEAIQGIRRAIYNSTDGKVLEGEIDGRRIRPFRIGDDPGSMRFADNQPPPRVKFESDIPDAIKSIFEQAKQSTVACSHGATRNAHAISTTGPALPQGDSGHGSNPQTTGGCIACEGACTAAGVICGAAAAVACAASFGLACGAIAGCAIAETVCWKGCHATGAPCCPVSCGDVACCDTAETCLNPNIGICCSKGLIGCANRHCCKPTDTCINATGFCCPKGQNVCNSVCCKPGEVCKDGVICCPPTQVVCAGVCCKKGEECKSGVCCPPAHVVCKGVCCKKGETCVDNKKCCSKTLACGKVCCEELSRCVDANKGVCCAFAVSDCNGKCCKLGERCINGKCCPNPCGDVCCGATEGCQNGKCISKNCSGNKVTCISQDAPGKSGEALCCPPTAGCCLGKCCKPGEGCCSGPGTPFGCHPLGACIA